MDNVDNNNGNKEANKSTSSANQKASKTQVVLGIIAVLFILASIYLVYNKYKNKADGSEAEVSMAKTEQHTTTQAATTTSKHAEPNEHDIKKASAASKHGEEEPAPTFETPALLIANNKLTITSLKSSKVKALPFKDGQNFVKDDVLVMFDCKELELDYAIQKAVVKEKESALSNIKKLKSLNSTSDYSVVEAESMFEQASRLYEKMEYQLANCVIKADYAGKVISTQVTEAEYATAGQDVMTVTNNEDLLVKAYVQAGWLNWLKLGNKFKFCFNETNECFSGVIVRIGAEVDPTSQTIDIFGKLTDAKPERLIPGLSAQASFEKP